MKHTIRFATPEDVPAIFALIAALAEYEKLTHLLTGSAADLGEHLFGERVYIESIVAEVAGKIVGFALFFPNYSTFLTKPGIYLEDIFVLPDYRGRGIGKALLVKVANIALERDAGRLEWTVLDWNRPAIDFYERMGASILKEWQICRVTGPALEKLGQIE